MFDFDFPTIDASAIAKSIESIKVDTPAQHMWADEQFEILKRYIQEFEAY